MPNREGVIGKFDGLGAVATNASNAIAGVGSALDGINRSVLDGGNSMQALSQSIDSVATAARQFSGVIDELVSIVPGLGGVGDAFGVLGSIFENIGTVMGGFVNVLNEAAGVMDGLTGINRETAASLYDAAAGFGATMSEAKLYRDMVLSMTDDFAKKDFGFIRLNESKAMFEAARQSKLSMEDLAESVTAAGVTMKGYVAGILQAAAMGIELTGYTNLLGDAIYGQGLDTKEAMTQLALFKDVSQDTGVSLDDVAGVLQGVSRSFRTLGVQADFGEPLLRGFANSLDDIGLGAENAKSLTEGLSASIVKIATDPALAYITSSFGDLGYGSGGTALGASIDLQAKLLTAEKTGDQSAVGLEMANAMRESLMKMSGSESIITVTEASENPALETAFYKQQKILEGIFGIDKNSSARTLEMLADLDEATRTGNTEAAEKLASDLAQGKNVRNETRGWQDAMAAKVDGVVSELAVQTGSLLTVAHHMGLLDIDDAGDSISSEVKEFLSKASVSNKAASKTADGLTSGAITDEDLRNMKKEVGELSRLRELVLSNPNLTPDGAGSTGNQASSLTADVSEIIPFFKTMDISLKSVSDSIGALARIMGESNSIPGQPGGRNG